MQVTCARIGTRVYLRRFANILALTVRNTYRGFCLSLAPGPSVHRCSFGDAMRKRSGNVGKVCVRGDGDASRKTCGAVFPGKPEICYWNRMEQIRGLGSL
jgi:hypothetical protein